jgi:hypothetical protein
MISLVRGIPNKGYISACEDGFTSRIRLITSGIEPYAKCEIWLGTQMYLKEKEVSVSLREINWYLQSTAIF